MILRNKLNTLKITENKNINDYPNVYNISFQ